MKTIYILSACLTFFAGCVSSPSSLEGGEVIYFDEENKATLNDISYEFIPLETREDNLIGNINKVEIAGNRVFVLDANMSKALYVFDLNGKYLGEVGKFGDGPGEYSRLTSFYIDTDKGQIMLIAPENNQLLFYDLETYAHLYTKRLPISFLSCIPFPENRYAFYSAMGYDRQRGKYFVQTTDSTFTDTGAYFYEANFITSIHLSAQNEFQRGDDNHLFHLPYDPVIYGITEDGFSPLYSLKHSRYEFPPIDYLNSIGAGGANYTGELMSSDYIASYAFHEISEFILMLFLVNRKMEVAMYDKRNGKTYDMTAFREEGKQMNLTPFVGTSEDRFISAIEPNKNTIKYFKGKYEITEEDNPILCLIKFKG